MDEIAYRQHRALEETHWWFVGMRAIHRKQLESLGLSAGSRILDVGCGTGGNLALLESFGRAWAVDASPTAVSFVRQRGWPRIAVASATDLPFGDESFDVTTAFGVIEHVERDDRMLEEMRRVTRLGGHLLVLTSAHRWLWSVHDDRVQHIRRYGIGELEERVSRAGWRIDQLSYVNSALFPAVAAVRLLQRVIPERKGHGVQGMSGFGVPPRPLNHALAGLLALEGSLLSRMDLPMGVGLICRATRAEGASAGTPPRRAG